MWLYNLEWNWGSNEILRFWIKFNPNENSVPWQWLRLVPEILHLFGIVISVTAGSLNYYSGLHKWSTENHSLCPVLNLNTLTIHTEVCMNAWLYVCWKYIFIYMDIKPRLWILPNLDNKVPVKYLVIQYKIMDQQTKP